VEEPVEKFSSILTALTKLFEKQREVERLRKDLRELLYTPLGEVKEVGDGLFEFKKKVYPKRFEPKWLAKLLFSEELLSQDEVEVKVGIYGLSRQVRIWTEQRGGEILDAELRKLRLADVLIMAFILEPSDIEEGIREAEKRGRETAEILEKLKSIAATVKLLL
jgi:hypothetical protein